MLGSSLASRSLGPEEESNLKAAPGPCQTTPSGAQEPVPLAGWATGCLAAGWALPNWPLELLEAGQREGWKALARELQASRCSRPRSWEPPPWEPRAWFRAWAPPSAWGGSPSSPCCSGRTCSPEPGKCAPCPRRPQRGSSITWSWPSRLFLHFQRGMQRFSARHRGHPSSGS